MNIKTAARLWRRDLGLDFLLGELLNGVKLLYKMNIRWWFLNTIYLKKLFI